MTTPVTNDAFRYEMLQDEELARAQDRRDYLRPIVDRHFDDPLDMFDAITHEKGAAVLDMLRYVVDGASAASHPASQGETPFRALHHYLVLHHTHTATTGDLIDALRESTGLELGWCFHEWVFMAGALGRESVTVQVRDSPASQEFEIPLAFAPAWVDFDPDGFIDKTLDFPQPVAALAAKAERDPHIMSR